MDFILTAPIRDQLRVERLKKYASYFLLSRETGVNDPENPYEHIHAFVQLRRSQTVSWVLERVGVGINVQPRRGTCEQAMEYVMKDGDFYQEGQVVEREAGQGARTDLIKFVEDCKTESDASLWSLHPNTMVRYNRVPDKVREAFSQHRTKVTKMTWIFGPSGCGKTLYVQQKWPALYIKDKTQWWNGYTGQEVVLVDELNQNLIHYDQLLELGNKTPLRVQVKGGYVNFVAELVVLISNIPPQVVYQTELQNNDALLRRVKFYQASRAGPHKLLLQLVTWNGDSWEPVGESFERHVDYDDEEIVDPKYEL